MGVLECNKVRRTGLFPGAVVAMEKMNPSTAGRGGLCLGKEAASADSFTPSTPVVGRGEGLWLGLGPGPEAGTWWRLGLQGLQQKTAMGSFSHGYVQPEVYFGAVPLCPGANTQGCWLQGEWCCLSSLEWRRPDTRIHAGFFVPLGLAHADPDVPLSRQQPVSFRVHHVQDVWL